MKTINSGTRKESSMHMQHIPKKQTSLFGEKLSYRLSIHCTIKIILKSNLISSKLTDHHQNYLIHKTYEKDRYPFFGFYAAVTGMFVWSNEKGNYR